MRTREGLPFVATEYMRLILESVLARVQRNKKVILCHFLWMKNHVHIIIVARDSVQCTRFYGEVQKQLTEAVKRLLGRSHLNLWQSNGTSVIRYEDVEGIIKQIGYIYANPARANLEDRIERYPALSTFETFTSLPNTLDAEQNKSCPWIRLSDIKELPSASVTAVQDRTISQRLIESATQEHTLSISPNAWMNVFRLKEDDVAEVNKKIIATLRDFEAQAREERIKAGRKTMGAERLKREPLTLNYYPKKESQKIFIYATCKKIRIALIKAYELFCQECRECYEQWKIGNYRVVWPPGAFLPAMPPRYNALEL